MIPKPLQRWLLTSKGLKMSGEGVTLSLFVLEEVAVQQASLFHLTVSQEMSDNKTVPAKWLSCVNVAFCC